MMSHRVDHIIMLLPFATFHASNENAHEQVSFLLQALIYIVYILCMRPSFIFLTLLYFLN